MSGAKKKKKCGSNRRTFQSFDITPSSNLKLYFPDSKDCINCWATRQNHFCAYVTNVMQQMVAKHSFHFGTEFSITLAHQEQLYIGNTQDSSGGKIGGWQCLGVALCIVAILRG